MIGLNQVYNEDCLIGMQRIPDKSIDMILCDLPYGTTACKWDVIIPFEPLWEQYERVIKDNGAIVLTASQPFTTDVINSNRRLFKHEWIWEKSRAANFANAKYCPLKKHENIIVFCRGSINYCPIMEDGEPYGTRHNTIRKDYGVYGTSRNLDSYGGEKQIRNTRFPSSVIKVGSMRQQDLEHPTQKPVALFEYLIKTYTNEGETVLDNCMGSGTTAIACINTNRNYIGFEKEEKYFNIIQDRIKKHTVQLKLIA